MPISYFKTKVMLEQHEFYILVRKIQLIPLLRERLLDEHALLLTALHELAVVKEKEPQHFSRSWLNEKRRVEDPVPVTRSPRQRGGEAQVGF